MRTLFPAYPQEKAYITENYGKEFKMIEFKFLEGDCFKIKAPEDDFNLIGKLNSIPGGKYLKGGKFWKFPLSVRIYRELKEKLGVSHPELDWELRTTMIPVHESKTKLRGHQMGAAHETLREFGFEYIPKELGAEYTPGEREKLRKPLLPRGSALFMEMGTGKTLTAINIADTLHLNGYVGTVLVIAPLPIVDTWGNPDPEVGELAKHSAVNHHTSTLTGTKSQKTKAMEVLLRDPHPMKWALINPEGIGRIIRDPRRRKKVFKYFEGMEDLKPDLVIIDESTMIKNHGTARGELITKLLYHTPYKIIMSGNPIPKGGHEVFGQYLFMDQGVFGDKFYRFRDRFCAVDHFNGISGMQPAKEAEFERLFHSACFVARKKDCLDLPPKTYEKRIFEMAPEQARAYKDMRKEAMVAMEDLSCSADVVITKYLRLSQITGGFLPLEDEDGVLQELRRFKSQPGLDAMVADITYLPNEEQVVIWARFQEEIRMIHERLEKEGISSACYYGPVSQEGRVEARRQFREKEIKAIICSSAASKGLNDFIGATFVCYYSNDYSAETREQSEDRNHRSGVVGDKVTYVDYIAKGSIDEKVLSVLRDNKDFSTAILEERRKKQK